MFYKKYHPPKYGLDPQHGINVESVFKYKCTFCPKAFMDAYKLKIHLRRKHMVDQRVRCPKCTSSFATQREVDKHMLVHEEPNLKCPRCDKLFRWRENILQHLQGNGRLITDDSGGNFRVAKSTKNSH